MQISKHVWLLIFAAILAGMLLPAPGTFLKPLLSYLLIGLMTFSCLQIKPADIKKALQHRQIYLVTAITLFATPILAWLAKPILDPIVFAGLILATAAPAGVSIVYISELFKGKTADALSITTLSHLLSIITIPAILLLFVGKSVPVSAYSILLSLLKFVIVPLFLAQVIRPFLAQKHKEVFTASTIMLLLIIWIIIAPIRGYITTHLTSITTIFIISAACITISFIFGWLTGKSYSEKITYSISASYKNYTLSTVIAFTVLGETAALASIAYTLFNNIIFAIADLYVIKK